MANYDLFCRQSEKSSNNFIFLSCLDHAATCRLLKPEKEKIIYDMRGKDSN